MKPLKSDFSNYVQFTANIEDRIIDFHIDDAFYYSIKPKLGNRTESSKDLSEAISILSSADSLTKPQLTAFFNNYLKRYWILLAFKRFLQNHGRNVTQFGYTKLRDPEGTFEQVDSEERAVYLKQLQHDINIAETNLFVELNAKRWTFDTFTYSSTNSTPPKKSFGINAVGGNDKRRGCDPYAGMYTPLSSSGSTNNDYDDDYA